MLFEGKRLSAVYTIGLLACYPENFLLFSIHSVKQNAYLT